MKKLVLALSALMLVFAFAACSKSTKLTIDNAYVLTIENVSYLGTSFGTIQAFDEKTEEVDSGSDYVYWDALGMSFRTYYLVKAENHETTTFTLTGNTIVVKRKAGSRGIEGDGAPMPLKSLMELNK